MMMKEIVGRYILLTYPIYSEEFIIHNDANKTSFGWLMSQNDNTIAFY